MGVLMEEDNYKLSDFIDIIIKKDDKSILIYDMDNNIYREVTKQKAIELANEFIKIVESMK